MNTTVLILLGLLAAMGFLLAHTGGSDSELARERRQVHLARTLGLLFGVLAAWLLGRSALLPESVSAAGDLTMLYAVLAAIGLLAGVAIGELFVRRPDPAVARTASLSTRRLQDYLPRRMSAAVLGCATVGAGLLWYTSVTATVDLRSNGSMGVLARTCAPGRTVTRGPYPDIGYSITLSVLVALAFVIAAVATHRVLRQPRGIAVPGGDAALRRRSLQSVVAGLGIAVCAPLAAPAFAAAIALLGHPCPPPAGDLVGLVALVLAPICALTALWCVFVVVVGPAPAPRATRSEPQADTRAGSPGDADRR